MSNASNSTTSTPPLREGEGRRPHSRSVLGGCLLAMLCFPIMFIGPHDDISVRSYLSNSVIPLSMVVAFVANYFGILPYTIRKDDRRFFFVSNIILIAVIISVLYMWHDWEFSLRFAVHEGSSRPFHGGHGIPKIPLGAPSHLMIAFRDVINVCLAIALAYSISLSTRLTTLRIQQAQSEVALRDAEVARREAELRLLHNQISPHFLLNTLNNIYSLAAISTQRTQDAVMQLSQMLRHMLYGNQSEAVSIHSELEFILAYVNLMKLRLASNVAVETHIDVAPNSPTTIAPLLFISLVENAFKHGVSATEPCNIDISITEPEQGVIDINIINSNHPKESTDRSGHGIGLRNVEQRLQMLYPEHYTWDKSIDSNNMYHSHLIIKQNDLCNN